MKNLVLILAAAFFSIGGATAQTKKEKYAQNLFNKMRYSEAAPVLSEVVQKQTKSGVVDDEMLRKSAISFYRIRDYSQSLKMLRRLDHMGKLSQNDFYLYVDCFLREKQFNEVFETCKKYKNFSENSLRTKDILFSDHWLNALQKDSMNFKVVPIQSLNSGAGDFAPFLSGNKMYFTSTRNQIGYTNSIYAWDNSNYCKVYSADKKTDYDFQGVLLEKELGSKFHDGAVTISPDGKFMFVTRNDLIEKNGKLVQHLSLIEYTSVNGSWKEITSFPFNSETYSCGHASYSGDGKTIYFASDMPGGFGGSDIYKSVKKGSEWTKPVNLGNKMNTNQDEMFPFITGKGDIYFSSTGFPGLGGFDIYLFTLKDGKVQNLGYPLNSSSDDISFILENEIGYFGSDREGVDKIYAVAIKPISGTLLVNVINEEDGLKITDSEVYLVNKDTKDTTRVYLNETGNFEFPILKNQNYEVLVKKTDYYMTSPVILNTEDLSADEKIPVTSILRTDFMELTVKSINKESKVIVPGVKGSFRNPESGEIVSFLTDSTGTAVVKIPTNTKYAVTASKKGYLDLNDTLITNKSVTLELGLPMVEIKKDLKFEVKNILYDFAKYDLRQESMVELDKLAEFLIVNNNIKVELSSHTDCRGNDLSNEKLSQNRAQSCVNYLIAKGVNKENIIAKGYGERQLLNKCDDGINCSEEEHQENRRTEVKIMQVN